MRKRRSKYHLATVSALCAFLAALFLVMLGVPARAQTASIAGTVRSEEGDPIAECSVVVYPAEWECAHQVPDALDETETDEDGKYKLESLEAGSYKVKFEPGDGIHLPEWFNSASGRIENWLDATWINLSEGQSRTGVNGNLEITGRITGTVTSEDGVTPVEECRVSVYEVKGEGEYEEAGNASTDENGDYGVGMLETGQFVLKCEPNDDTHLEQWYDGKKTREKATVVNVVKGEVTDNIDPELWVGASIEGTVTMEYDGAAVENCTVEAVDAETEEPVASETTDDSGAYKISPLTGGDYKVSFMPGGLKGNQWYNGKRSFNSAAKLELSRGESAEDIDASIVWGDLENYAVTPQDYDDLGSLLGSLDASASPIDVSAGDTSAYEDLDNWYLMREFNTVFVNCTNCSNFADLELDKIKKFVREGGTLFATDCSGGYLISNIFPNKITFPDYFDQGLSQSIEATVIDEDLASFIGSQARVAYNHGGFAVLTDVADDVEVYMNGTVKTDRLGSISNMPLYMSFPFGDGEVYFSTFHLKDQEEELALGIMEQFLGGQGPAPPSPSTTWYLAEGSTGSDDSGNFETWVLVQNPGESDTRVRLTYMTEQGSVEGPDFELKASSRTSVEVAKTLPDTWSVSTKILSDEPVIAERSVYWNAAGVNRQCAHDSIGAIEPGQTWYLAEGSTGSDDSGNFETWILVQNPGEEEATVNLTYMTEEGAVEGPELQLEGVSRESVDVSEKVPNTWSVSTKVTSDVPVIAERSVYWNSATTSRQAAHDSIGVQQPGKIWYLAEGSTGSGESGSFETWILVQNPGEEAANVNLTYMTEDGETPGPEFVLEGGSRTSFDVSKTISNRWSVSTKVTSDEPVIAERSVYWNTAGMYRQCAHDAIGVNVASTTWYLAEGSTGSDPSGGFETWILVQNPNSEEVDVSLTYMTEDGIVAGPDFKLEANSRTSIDVSAKVPGTWSVSTEVSSNRQVIAERSVYWNAAALYRQAAHDSIGAIGSR